MIPVIYTLIFILLLYFVFKYFERNGAQNLAGLTLYIMIFGALGVYLYGNRIIPTSWFTSDIQYECSLSDVSSDLNIAGVSFNKFIFIDWQTNTQFKELDFFPITKNNDINFKFNLFANAVLSYPDNFEDDTDYSGGPWLLPPDEGYRMRVGMDSGAYDSIYIYVTNNKSVDYATITTSKPIPGKKYSSEFEEYHYKCKKLKEPRVFKR